MVVVLTQLVKEDQHMFMLANFLHHESVDLFVSDRGRVHLLKLVQNFEQLALIFNQRIGCLTRARYSLHLCVLFHLIFADENLAVGFLSFASDD